MAAICENREERTLEEDAGERERWLLVNFGGGGEGCINRVASRTRRG
jgi:hypothetical protein